MRITPKEIWLFDFKSDRLEGKELAAATARYKPQILLYGTALSAIYKRPVTRKGIFFLSLKQFEWLERANATSAAFQQLELYI